MMRAAFKKSKVFLLFGLAAAILHFVDPDLSERAWLNSFHFAVSVLSIFPPILLLLDLLSGWLPPGAVESHLGRGSGAKGVVLALGLGSFAAGPLFTAFPIAASFTSKGGRIANAVIFMGAWATIKVPMLMMESHFLGVKFSMLRFVVTVPFLILIGMLMEKLMAANETSSLSLELLENRLQ
jgi:uncharacterized membrane protein YraQ (UPF0718 family)